MSIAFEPIKLQLKRDLRKYDEYIDKQKLNGLKGGRPKNTELSEVKAALQAQKALKNKNQKVKSNKNK